MESKSRKRQQDSIAIPEGSFIEPYTPTPGPIISPCLQLPLAYAKVHMSEEGTITGKDRKGNTVTDLPLGKGQCPYLFSEISSASVSLWIVHEGVISSEMEIMNYPIKGIDQ